MQTQTRLAFNGYLRRQAELNELSEDDVKTKFSATPSVQQSLESAIQESSSFLKEINVIGVDEQKGEAILMKTSGTMAGRSKRSVGPRTPRYMGELSADEFECVKTDFDSAYPYAILDQWAKFPDFQKRLSNQLTEQQALDRIMIGFNGTSAADATDREANPLLEDVNIGWLQKMRTKATDRVITEGVEASGEVTVGVDGDYLTLDGLVFDAVELLDPWHRKNPNLVVIVSRNLIHARFLSAVEKSGASNVDDLAAEKIITRTKIGGLPYVDAPFFPDNTVMVTTLKNLSIYYQNGKRRRHIKDEPENDQVADYQSTNDAYVIEDFGLCAVVENITPSTPIVESGN